MPKLGVSGYMLKSSDRPLDETFECVVEAGYDGIELSHQLHGRDFGTTKTALEKTGLDPFSVHIQLNELERNTRQIVRRYEEIGCRSFVYHPDLYVRTEKRVSAVVERAERLAEKLDRHGCTLLVHPNHRDFAHLFRGPILGQLPWFTRNLESSDHLHNLPFVETRINRAANSVLDHIFENAEYKSVDTLSELASRTPFGYWLSKTERVEFEIDIAFLVQTGFEPAEVFDFVGRRAPIVHMKDVRPEKYEFGGWPSWVDPGEGEADFVAAGDAAVENGTEWLVYENGHADDPIASLNRGAEALAKYKEIDLG